MAEISTSARGLATEVEFGHVGVGLEHESVINSDSLHTIAQVRLTAYVGAVDEATLARVCAAARYAIGC